MVIIKKDSLVKDKRVTVELPEDFNNKEVEITIRLKSTIEKDLLIDQVAIDTTKWKFNREEIHAR
jgi:hypothetical protein